MSDDWEARVAAFWATADDQQPARLLSEMRSLAADRPANDPTALYEWASVHDFVGREEEAIPLYQAALEHGLTGGRRPQAIIQLASSLRNIGQPAAAVELLQPLDNDDVTGDAAQAFLALAQWDRGQHAAALRTALTALSRSLPLYQHAVADYAAQLSDPHELDS
jgi:tetratricopeptide (TPR) repeat protein